MQLDGYRFPVYTTPSCPRDEAEWTEKSSMYNCPKYHSYACIPNENFTMLLEFCYPLPQIAVAEGKCFSLRKNPPIYYETCSIVFCQ